MLVIEGRACACARAGAHMCVRVRACMRVCACRSVAAVISGHPCSAGCPQAAMLHPQRSPGPSMAAELLMGVATFRLVHWAARRLAGTAGPAGTAA